MTPKIILHTQIKDIESKVERESAIVGEPLLWDIDGPGKSLFASSKFNLCAAEPGSTLPLQTV